LCYLAFIMLVLTISFFGCKSHIATFYWEEHENQFNTNDLTRARKEIPFPIVIPTYSPENTTKEIFPDIEGPIKQFQGENNIEIIIRYGLDLGNKLHAAVMIYESNFASSLGDPELNLDLELIEIEGVTVIKTKDDFSAGLDSYYSFNSKGIYYNFEMHYFYYNVETHYLPNKEAYKIVESMIVQIKSE
jgi:hypothetical protein